MGQHQPGQLQDRYDKDSGNWLDFIDYMKVHLGYERDIIGDPYTKIKTSEVQKAITNPDTLPFDLKNFLAILPRTALSRGSINAEIIMPDDLDEKYYIKGLLLNEPRKSKEKKERTRRFLEASWRYFRMLVALYDKVIFQETRLRTLRSLSREISDEIERLNALEDGTPATAALLASYKTLQNDLDEELDDIQESLDNAKERLNGRRLPNQTQMKETAELIDEKTEELEETQSRFARSLRAIFEATPIFFDSLERKINAAFSPFKDIFEDMFGPSEPSNNTRPSANTYNNQHTPPPPRPYHKTSHKDDSDSDEGKTGETGEDDKTQKQENVENTNGKEEGPENGPS